MPKKDPFIIPYCSYGKPTSTKAHITVMTTDRVRGTVTYTDHVQLDPAVPFDVKNDGTSFSIGSGSSKKRFYFNNWDK